MLLKAGTIKRLHVNQHNLRANRKNGGRRPVFSVQTSKGVFYGHHVDIKGPSQLVSRPDKPLPCGARIWIETKAEVRNEQLTTLFRSYNKIHNNIHQLPWMRPYAIGPRTWTYDR